MSIQGPRRVALVHDNLIQFGGAERVLLAFMELFPHAPVYTLIYNSKIAPILKAAGPHFEEKRIRTSFLQHLPGAKTHYHYYPLAMPLAVERFDLTDFDLVLSSTYSFAKGIVTGPATLHLSYCFTPTRYVWDDCHQYVRDFARLSKFLRFAPLGLSYIRLWDYYASQRVDQYLTLSNFVAQRIAKYYGQVSEVIPPPVEVDRFQVQSKDEGYYLLVSRLVPYKKVAEAIWACQYLDRPLKVVGTGPEFKKIKSLAGGQTEVLGFVSEDKLPQLYGGAKALLFPQEEDFGITPLEAAATGKPTIAYGVGGATETVIDGQTGIFFAPQTVQGLVEAIKKFETMSFDPYLIRAHAEKYSRANFLRRITDTVQTQWMSHQQKYQVRP